MFVDEMRSNTLLFSLYAWAPRGERALCSTPRLLSGRHTTLLARMSLTGMESCVVAVVGSTTHNVSESYDIKQGLPPAFRPGQVVLLDNLEVHKGESVRELIEARGWKLLCLLPYSPDLNPYLRALSRRSRRCCSELERTREALWWRLWGGRCTL